MRHSTEPVLWSTSPLPASPRLFLHLELLDKEGSAAQETSQQGEARAPQPERSPRSLRPDEGSAQPKTEVNKVILQERASPVSPASSSDVSRLTKPFLNAYNNRSLPLTKWGCRSQPGSGGNLLPFFTQDLRPALGLPPLRSHRRLPRWQPAGFVSA